MTEPATDTQGADAPRLLPGAFPLTDSGNGERFAARYRGELRYSPERRRWLAWNGSEWEWDDGIAELRCKDLARAIHQEADDCNDEREVKALRDWARKSEGAGKRENTLKLARSEPGMRISVDDLDRDPWLLNCSNGTLDLRSGALGIHRRDQLITKQTGVRYVPDAGTLLWDEVVANMTGGDASLAAYLQRVAGYALTGLATERKCFFLYGPPGSGKSTFLEALMGCLGDYAQAVSFDTWLEHPNVGGNRDDLVKLQGVRLVTSAEVSATKHWDTALLKKFTGGDRIEAQGKYEKPVSYIPSCTLMFVANDSPKARDDDAGFWERMQRVPITNVVARDKRIKNLHGLMREPENAEAILAWAVAGCKEWQRMGIGSAPSIDASTEAYREENDWIGGFLETFELAENCSLTGGEFRTLYENYCKQEGQRPEATKTLARRIQARTGGAVRYIKTHDGSRVWKGLVRRVQLPAQPSLPGVEDDTPDDMPPSERFT